jgi:predicted lipid-binding transport protein (Tim44 family)
MERSITPGSPGDPQANPGFGQTAPRGGFFGRPGFMGGLFGGLLGAGLLGMLFGGSFFGGLSGGGSILGLLLQLGIAFFLIRWAIRAFSSRSQPATAAGPGMNSAYSGHVPDSQAAPPSGSVLGRGLGGLAGLGSSRSSNAPLGSGDELGVGQADLDRFEQLLGEIQTAYGKEDLAGLRRHTTPEMLSYLTEELTDNASRGVINRVTDIKLLSGDVAESWREGSNEFVTVAMRYSLTDISEDRETGRVIETGPGEATELWTFRRAAGGDWLLAALQQT